MSEIFIIRNQLGHFWGKSKTWVDGSDARAVMRVKNRDEATNTLFELSSKDFELRGDILEAEANTKGDPMVQVSDIPLPEVPDAELDPVEAAAVEAAAVDTAVVDAEASPSPDDAENAMHSSDESITDPKSDALPD
jgi:hypothetical protein